MPVSNLPGFLCGKYLYFFANPPGFWISVFFVKGVKNVACQKTSRE